MAAQNKKRKKSRKGRDFHALWGSFFRKETPQNDVTHGTLFGGAPEEEETAAEISIREMLRRWLVRVSVWRLISFILFGSFILFLFIILVRMWLPQDLKSIAGNDDNMQYRNLTAYITTRAAQREANITITEADLNRYLKNTCALHQDSIFSLLVGNESLLCRVHDGYIELIIDRVIDAGLGIADIRFHQTTSVYLTFTQEIVNGEPKLNVEFKGGEPIWGEMPRGGCIGRLPIPQRHILMLQPALANLRDSYPEIRDTIMENGYCPVFEKGVITLKRYVFQTTPQNNQ